VSAVIVGGTNTNGLLDEEGGTDVDGTDVSGGSSIQRTSAGWVEAVSPSPGDCTHAP
jgi:hypothetical protein